MYGGPPGEPEAEVGQVGIVLLGEFGSCAVIAVGDDSADGAVVVQGGVQRAIGGKGCQSPVRG